MTNLADLKAAYDLRTAVEADLGRPRSRGQKVSNWQCPLHQEHKGASLAVWADGWRCFGACNTGGDAISWLMEYRGLTFVEAMRALGGDSSILTQSQRHSPSDRRPVPVLPPAAPPSADWQAAAQAVVEQAEATLWSPVGARALHYLRQERALQDATIREARLGYLPGHYREWRSLHGLLVPCGITLPWWAAGQLWGIKVRRAAGDNKYVEATTTQEAVNMLGKPNLAGGLYWADHLHPHWPVLLVEGEFNCLIAWQEGRDLVCPLSLGAAGRSLNARWYASLIAAPVLFALYDQDPAGQHGIARFSTLTQRIRPLQMPDGLKDLNDFAVFCRVTQCRGGVHRWLQAMMGQQGQATDPQRPSS